MLWILIVVSMAGGIHYEEFGWGPSNGWDCVNAAKAINQQTPSAIRAYCIGAEEKKKKEND